jgi:hypothetical protein
MWILHNLSAYVTYVGNVRSGKRVQWYSDKGPFHYISLLNLGLFGSIEFLRNQLLKIDVPPNRIAFAMF